MASQEAWNLAQKYSAAITMKILSFAGATAIFTLFIPGLNWVMELMIGLFLFFGFLLSIILINEKRLKEIFDDRVKS